MYEYDAKFVFIRLEDAQAFFGLAKLSRVLNIELAISRTLEGLQGNRPYRWWLSLLYQGLDANESQYVFLRSSSKDRYAYYFRAPLYYGESAYLSNAYYGCHGKRQRDCYLEKHGRYDASIMKIFVTYGLFVGGLGAASGGALGLAVCLLIEKIGIRLDPDVYYFPIYRSNRKRRSNDGRRKRCINQLSCNIPPRFLRPA